MEELLKTLYHNELNLSREDEKEKKATKELSAEYSRAYERCADSMSPEGIERLNILLDIAGDIEAVRDGYRFIRYAIFGAQLQRELMGDASSSGSVPFFASISQSFNEARPFQELIHSDSKAYQQASEKVESLADELIDTYPAIREKLDEYLTTVCQQYAIHEEDIFDYAFKMGARTILKILGDDRTL